MSLRSLRGADLDDVGAHADVDARLPREGRAPDHGAVVEPEPAAVPRALDASALERALVEGAARVGAASIEPVPDAPVTDDDHVGATRAHPAGLVVLPGADRIGGGPLVGQLV